MNTTSQMRDDLAGARDSVTSGELFTGVELYVRDGANSRRESEMELDQFEGHTPGPLACVELMAFAAGFAAEDGEGRTVARIMKTHGVERLPSRANAALFAAAPELLAEVRRLTAEADALRRERDDLAARLAEIEHPPGRVVARYGEHTAWAVRRHDGTQPDKERAYCVAVTICAAEIGRRMREGGR